MVRGPKREFISRSYNFLLQSFMGAHFSDAQCGFKAIRADVARQLLPHTLDNAWFFDTELLVLAEKCGLRVHEVPVDWTDDPDSSVDIVQTALADLRGMARLSRDLVSGRIPVPELRAALARGPLPAASRAQEQSPGGSLFGQLVRFGSIGVASTLAYLVIFLLCRGLMDPQLANFLALLTTAVANTAANRRFTFGIQGGSQAARHHFEGLLVFGIGLALTSGALALVHGASGGDAGPLAGDRHGHRREPGRHRREVPALPAGGLPPGRPAPGAAARHPAARQPATGTASRPRTETAK